MLFHVYLHTKREGLRTIVHGDDYCTAGTSKSLDWFQKALEAKYQIKTQRIGQGPGKVLEGQVLNRVVRMTSRGYELEADLRHAELVVEQLGLKASKGVSTPGRREDKPEGEQEGHESEKELTNNEATLFRGIAARCNYLAFDRPDMQYAAKEICREMSKPTNRALDRLERLGRYLKQCPRLVRQFDQQTEQETMEI